MTVHLLSVWGKDAVHLYFQPLLAALGSFGRLLRLRPRQEDVGTSTSTAVVLRSSIKAVYARPTDPRIEEIDSLHRDVVGVLSRVMQDLMEQRATLGSGPASTASEQRDPDLRVLSALEGVDRFLKMISRTVEVEEMILRLKAERRKHEAFMEQAEFMDSVRREFSRTGEARSRGPLDLTEDQDNNIRDHNDN